MARAIIAGGEPVYVDADVRIWTDTGLGFGPRPLRSETRAVVLHWTGGEGGGPEVHRTLAARGLSVHFTIDQAGVVWQHLDANALSAGCKGANAWCVNVEVSNRSRPHVANAKWPRESYVDSIHGRDRQTTRFLPAQVDAALDLVSALCRRFDLPVDVPRGLDGKLVSTALPAGDLAVFRGVLGHLHVTTAKDDPGTEILRAVALRGGRAA